MGFFRSVDQFSWAADLDVVSVDSYPDPADAESYLLSAMTCDLTRSVARLSGAGAVGADGAGAERRQLAAGQRAQGARAVPGAQPAGGGARQ